MKIFNILKPTFFRRLDTYLLVNHPFIWKTYVHYFLFYSFLVGNTLLILAALLWPVSSKAIPQYNTLLSVSNGMGFILSFPVLYWLYQLNRGTKNIFTWKQALLSIGMYLLCSFSLYTNFWTFTFTHQYKILYVITQAGFEADNDYFLKAKKAVYRLDDELHRFEGFSRVKVRYIPKTHQIELHFKYSDVAAYAPLSQEEFAEQYKELSAFMKEPNFQKLVILNSLAEVLNDSTYKDRVADDKKLLYEERLAILNDYVASHDFHPLVLKKLKLKVVENYQGKYDEYYFDDLNYEEIQELLLLNDPKMQALFPKYGLRSHNFHNLKNEFENIAQYQNQSFTRQFQESVAWGMAGGPMFQGNTIQLFICFLSLGALMAFWAAMLKSFTFIKLLLTGLASLAIGMFSSFLAVYLIYEMNLDNQTPFNFLHIIYGVLILGSTFLLGIAHLFPSRIGAREQILHVGLHNSILLIVYTVLMIIARGWSSTRPEETILVSSDFFAFYLMPALIFSYIMTYILLRKINLVPRRK